MEDIISLSSGSDSDSDLEVVGCFSDDTKQHVRPFITSDWIPVKPVVIELSKLRRIRSQRWQRDSIEVVDLSHIEEVESNMCVVLDDEDSFPDHQGECQILCSPSAETNQDIIIVEKSKDITTTTSHLPPVCVDTAASNKGGNGLQPDHVLVPATLNSDQNISVENSHKTDSTEESSHLQGSELQVLEKCSPQKYTSESIPSPLSLNSPSDVNPVLSSCDSNMHHFKERTFVTDLSDHQMEPSSCTPSLEEASTTMFGSTESQTSCTQKCSVMSVSGVSRTPEPFMSAEHQHGVPCLQSCPPYPTPEGQCQELEGTELVWPLYDGPDVSNRLDEPDNISVSDLGPAMSVEMLQKQQLISHIQLKKLKRHMGAVAEDVAEEEAEEHGYGPPELLCRQSLSLVYSTIEENYPELTLRLLSDFLQPRYYPPPGILAHLLRGILMDPNCPDILALEAYNLLMRVQIFHPSDMYTLPWDWELLTSVMDQQAGTTSGLRLEVRRMLLQYVLQILEDDFQRHLCLQKLHLSIAKAVLSCEQNFTHVRELITWLFEAVSMAVSCKNRNHSVKERNENLMMVTIFQKMLVLALEVDRTPTCSSNKLSQELFHVIISSPKREQRLLLLDTLESNLLKCKLLELLLDYECPQKIPVPMSLTLLLHFLQHSILSSDPTDGSEHWRRWAELIKLICMLLLSYAKVMKGHLRCSITERSTYSRDPSWTMHDRITQAMVRDACDAFLARTERDLGCSPPAPVQESLALLKAHLQHSH
ncbi:hypothetical protein ACEWY4_026764 [Coilia grayii]|uniref:SUMO-interacting motif-containing protein 1 n=1 Tax=Coilia grayii TaxID=363190 RepID=A0ABD1ISR2_9TELE